jgi:predicted homoserine dehydrogenase-like protein
MSLYARAMKRVEYSRPIGVALIGAGKFGSMFLAQVPTMPGIVVHAIVDLDPERARRRLPVLGWEAERIAQTHFTTDVAEVLDGNRVKVVIEATGDPIAGIRHALQAIEARKHIVMVNVEADALAGPALSARARRHGVRYSLAYGDQPALIAELVDWARLCGFRVAAAGKGTRYLPEYHSSTPETVWGHYGLTADEAHAAGMNSQMFNSFLDGTKSAIEMAAVANCCGLSAPEDGLSFPPCSADDLAEVLGSRGASEGIVEVVSSLHRDGSAVRHDLRWGVFVVFEAPNDYAAACFRQYGLTTDRSGRYASMYRPFHLIGLELGRSIYSVEIQDDATGAPVAFHADAVAVAKRDLAAGETLDGEGGYTVWGKLVPARRSIEMSALPIGFAKNVTLVRAIHQGEIVRTGDIASAPSGPAAELRDETLRLADQ